MGGSRSESESGLRLRVRRHAWPLPRRLHALRRQGLHALPSARKPQVNPANHRKHVKRQVPWEGRPDETREQTTYNLQIYKIEPTNLKQTKAAATTKGRATAPRQANQRRDPSASPGDLRRQGRHWSFSANPRVLVGVQHCFKR